MVNGVIEFCKPEECTVKKEIHNLKMKSFTEGVNFSGLHEPELLAGYREGGV